MKFHPGIFFALVISSSLLGACAQHTAGPGPSVRRAHGIYHVVKPGENLFRIGKAYDIGFEDLARVNGIRDPGQIRVGQRILIPGATRALPVEIIAPVEIGPPSRSVAPAVEPMEEALLWPINGSINSGYGARGAGFHDGIDIGAPEGTPIHAVEKGEVIYSDQIRGYGNIVIVRHGGGIVSVYAHNQVNLVREGQNVDRGEVIAKVGSTGRVTGPHLHFEIRKHNAAQDPLRYLPQLCCVPASDNVAPKGSD
ncbi:MAG TPA: LysM peptidoglycan-binding domain-containing M23 family metallopeptidase [Pseudolabrys sp.]|nr:LysM peptidoglycan-binding domain-containing M23 family metallopeptidase [Pseudolabrys sp.]